MLLGAVLLAVFSVELKVTSGEKNEAPILGGARFQTDMSRRSTYSLPKPEPPDGVAITKIDAAKRQLETAVQLWFEDRDSVSIHTLISAAMGLLEPLARAKGTWRGVFDTSSMRPGMEEEYLALMKLHQNFFKHGSKDSNESISFWLRSECL
jgi:hypothetical protein